MALKKSPVKIPYGPFYELESLQKRPDDRSRMRVTSLETGPRPSRGNQTLLYPPRFESLVCVESSVDVAGNNYRTVSVEKLVNLAGIRVEGDFCIGLSSVFLLKELETFLDVLLQSNLCSHF